MRHRNAVINGALAVAVCAEAGVGYSIVHSSGGSSGAAAVRTTAVQRGTVRATVSGTGNVTSAVATAVSFTTCSGTVTSIEASVGAHVHSGQKLAAVDSTQARQAVSTAQLNYDGALTNRSNALTSAESGSRPSGFPSRSRPSNPPSGTAAPSARPSEGRFGPNSALTKTIQAALKASGITLPNRPSRSLGGAPPSASPTR